MLGGQFSGVTPLARVGNLSCPHIFGLPCFFRASFVDNFMYPVWGQEPGTLTQTNRRLLNQKRLFSPAYYTGQRNLTIFFAHE
jgi:hypothetical protein